MYAYLRLKTKQLVLSQEEDYREADSKLVEEDMRVMTDFELHHLCLLHQVYTYVRCAEQTRQTADRWLVLISALCMLSCSVRTWTYIHDFHVHGNTCA